MSAASPLESLGTLLKFCRVPRDMFTTRMLNRAWLSMTHCRPSATVSCRGRASLSSGSTRTPIRRACVATPISGFRAAAVPATWVPCPLGSNGVEVSVRLTASYHFTKFGARSWWVEKMPVSRIATPMPLPSIPAKAASFRSVVRPTVSNAPDRRSRDSIDSNSAPAGRPAARRTPPARMTLLLDDAGSYRSAPGRGGGGGAPGRTATRRSRRC